MRGWRLGGEGTEERKRRLIPRRMGQGEWAKGLFGSGMLRELAMQTANEVTH